MMRDGKPVVIDWMNACTGSALADVARTCIMLSQGELPHLPWVMRKLIALFQNSIRRVYLKRYIKQSGVRIQDINRWKTVIMAARLREGIPHSEKETLLRLIRKAAD